MRRIITLLFALGCAASTFAQARVPERPTSPRPEAGSLESIPEELRGEALVLGVSATVTRGADEEPWQASELKYTLNGMPVTLKMVGSAVIVYLTITTYPSRDADLAMITQGQVWFRQDDGSLHYRSTVETISVAFGERVLFYPLGLPDQGPAPLRIELLVRRYDPAQGTSPKP